MCPCSLFHWPWKVPEENVQLSEKWKKSDITGSGLTDFFCSLMKETTLQQLIWLQWRHLSNAPEENHFKWTLLRLTSKKDVKIKSLLLYTREDVLENKWMVLSSQTWSSLSSNRRTHSLKADTEEELEAWYLALRNKQVGVWYQRCVTVCLF